MTREATVAVVLARGLGSRMQRSDAAGLSDTQRAAAAAGLKAMIPDAAGRPFLDHVLTALADAGIREVILVVAPDHEAIADHFRAHPPARLVLRYAVQAEPLGTADAVLAAEEPLDGRDFLVLNADNLYPVVALRALVTLGMPGMVAFRASALVAQGNIPRERVAAFAPVAFDAAHRLTVLVEKPDAATLAAFGDDPWVSMNLWRFDHRILAACRATPRSVRGEHELPEAVRLAIADGVEFRALPLEAGVLDLSQRGDIAAVAAALADRPIAT
ncbi:MAG TPA: sugar phosphate nucleotidyltransferase [Gemmatimonadales bacterium]|nr:sugar phosphate nucleotidyltransferase [Gemmatimonadales bacterium]